jgi:hypothetical protein
MGETTPPTRWFRSRARKNGALEIWARGWRLEPEFVPIVPALLGVSLIVSPVPTLVRAVGGIAFIFISIGFLRLTKVGILLDVSGVTVVRTLKKAHVAWDDFVGFVGHRSEHGGRCMLLRRDGERIPAGSLEGEEMNPFPDEGDLSAVDELNGIAERFRREGLDAVLRWSGLRVSAG